jgi:hypothetical protein
MDILVSKRTDMQLYDYRLRQIGIEIKTVI